MACKQTPSCLEAVWQWILHLLRLFEYFSAIIIGVHDISLCMRAAVTWILPLMSTGRLKEVSEVMGRLGQQPWPMHELQSFSKMILLCLEKEPDDRPTFDELVDTLSTMT
eukprot:scaffold314792_cov20-Prasinocladus_malaysianus.AAC.1